MFKPSGITWPQQLVELDLDCVFAPVTSENVFTRYDCDFIGLH